MFESILVRPNIPIGVETDIGQLAEAMLFYKRTIVPANSSYVAALVKSVGVDDLLGLIDDGHIALAFVEDELAVQTKKDSTGIIEHHNFVTFELGGDQKKKVMSREEKLARAINQKIDDNRVATRVAQRILKKTSHYRLNTLLGKGNEVTGLARADIVNKDYIEEAAKTILEHYIPNYMKSILLKFQVVQTEMGFAIIHNLDFEKANLEFHKKFSKEIASLSMGFILSHIIYSRGEMALSSYYLSELVTTPLNHALLNLQFKHLLLKNERSAGEIRSFQDVILNGHTIREALNSGEKSVSDFRKLLDHAKKFKSWVDGVKPEAKLIAEYYESSITGTWVDSLPIKSLRFAICTALGFSGEVTGFTAGVIDSFLLDKILKGWRPHHFVQGELTKFVDSGA